MSERSERIITTAGAIDVDQQINGRSRTLGSRTARGR